MNRRTALRNLMAAGAGALVPRLFAHQGLGQDFVLKSEVRLVLLDVSVKDKTGAYVEELSKDNFKVYENGKPQQITTFSNTDVPVTAGILVDESRSMTPKRGEVISAAEAFIAESNRQDEMFVLNFNETVKPGLPEGIDFSGDLAQLRSALYRARPEGRTALNDAVVTGIKHLEKGKQGKKALLFISDGGDNASLHSRREMLNLAEGSIATIYTIGLYDPQEAEKDIGLIKTLARTTGGLAYLPKDLSELDTVCRGIAKDIRMRYTLGYPPQSDNGAVRHIRVDVSAAGHAKLIAHTRSEYRYES